MTAEKIIKQQAKKQLKDKGLAKAVFSVAILMFFYMLIENIFYLLITVLDMQKLGDIIYSLSLTGIIILGVVITFLTSPVILGFVKMYTNNAQKYDLSDLFYFFSSGRIYRKSLRFCFAFAVRLFLPLVFASIPIIALVIINEFLLDSTMNSALFLITMIILVLLSLLIIVALSANYYLATIMFCNNQEDKIKSYFINSKNMMTNYKSAPIKLYTSYILWFALCTTALPVIYILPYYTQAVCRSGQWILEISRDGQENELF